MPDARFWLYKLASTLWGNLVLQRRDAVLAKLQDLISFESFVDLCNARLSELFPAEFLERAVEKSSRVLHDEVIRKAVLADKPQLKSAKKLHFLQPSRQ